VGHLGFGKHTPGRREAYSSTSCSASGRHGWTAICLIPILLTGSKAEILYRSTEAPSLCCQATIYGRGDERRGLQRDTHMLHSKAADDRAHTRSKNAVLVVGVSRYDWQLEGEEGCVLCGVLRD